MLRAGSTDAGTLPHMIDFTGISRTYFRRVFEAEIRAEESLEAGQRRLLGELLRHSRDTRIGAMHGFGALRSYEEYASRVPVAD